MAEEFQSWVEANELSEDTVEILKDAGFFSLRSCKKLTEPLIQRHFSKSLPLAQILLLQDAVLTLQQEHSAQPQNNQSPATSNSVSAATSTPETGDKKSQDEAPAILPGTSGTPNMAAPSAQTETGNTGDLDYTRLCQLLDIGNGNGNQPNRVHQREHDETPRFKSVSAEVIPGTCNVKVSFQFEDIYREHEVHVQLQRCDDGSLTSWQVVQETPEVGKIKEWFLVDNSEKKNPENHYRVAVSKSKLPKITSVEATNVSLPNRDDCSANSNADDHNGIKGVRFSHNILQKLQPQEASIIGVDYQEPSLKASVKVKYQGDVYIALQRSEDPDPSVQWKDVAQYYPPFAAGQGQEEKIRETVLIDSEVKNHQGYYYRLRVSRSQKWEFAVYSQHFPLSLPPPCALIIDVLLEEGKKTVVVSYNLPYAAKGFIKLERLNNTKMGSWATVFNLNTKQALLGATDLKLVDSTEKESQSVYFYRIATAHDEKWEDAVYSDPSRSPPIPSIEE